MQAAWNKSKIVGRKPPLNLPDVTAIRSSLIQIDNLRDIAMFSTAIDSCLRGIDLVALNVSDVKGSRGMKEKVTIQQSKTGTRVSFCLQPNTRAAVQAWINVERKRDKDPLFTGFRSGKGRRIQVGTYRKLVKVWIKSAGLDPAAYGSHSLRRTRVAHIYKQTQNLRVVQLLLGHQNIETTTRYLGIEEDDTLQIAAQFEL